ncbi:MAG: GerMN domain-containing protein [Patescibacteria group bacterium]
MEKKILILLTAVLVLMIAAVLFIPAPKKDKTKPAPPSTSPNLKVYNLAPNQEITSPLVIFGEAKGWYFEASFSVKIQDEKGNVLAATPAQANPPVGGDWMTNEFVPFEAKLEFNQPTSSKGFVILSKDNPSGLKENSESVQIPVIFKMETSEIKAYFGNNKLDPEVSCNKVFPVIRKIPKTQTPGRAALEEMLKGPSPEEKSSGFFTSINPGVTIQKFVIQDGAAKVDFSPNIEERVGGSCRVAAISAQIIQTLKQFPTVKNVIISINGRTEDILQP